MTEQRTPWHDMRDWLVRAHGADAGEWLARRVGAKIRKTIGVDEMLCSNNFRTAAADNASAMAKYKKRREGGCCGFFDERFTFRARVYWVGFNYGH